MNDTNSAKAYFSKGHAKTLGVFKIIGAVLMIVAVIMIFASGSNSVSLGIMGSFGAGVASVGAILLEMIPILILIGMAIAWTVSLSRSTDPTNDGSILRSVSASSLTLSIVGFMASFSVMLILIGAVTARSSSQVSSPVLIAGSDKASGIISLILTGIGVLCLLPTAILRNTFYCNVQKSMNENTFYTGGASAYGAFKIINAIVKGGFGILMTVSLIRMLSAARGSAPATVIILLICIILAFLVGAAGNVIEALMAFGFKKAAAVPNAPGAYYPPQTPYQNTYPTYQDPAAAYPGYASPYDSAPYYPDNTPAQPQTSAQFCPNCGTPAKNGSAFCEFCGQRLQ